jgi:pyruvate kinase
MFDYDKHELANVLVHFLWLGHLYLLTLSLIVSELSAMVEKSSDDLDLILCNTCRAALKKGLVSDPNGLTVVTAGLPFGMPGAVNIIRVLPAAGPNCWDVVCHVD